MVHTVCMISLSVLFLCIGFNLIRVIKGPSMADRVLAADTIFLNLIGVATVYSVLVKTEAYFDLVLVFSLLGFIGTVSFSKFIQPGKIIK